MSVYLESSAGSTITTTQESTSKCALVAYILGAVAGITIITLSSLNKFGPKGSAGFIAATTGGSLLTFISLGSIVKIALINCKTPKLDSSPIIHGPEAQRRALEKYKKQKKVFYTAATNLLQSKEATITVELPSIQDKNNSMYAQEACRVIHIPNRPDYIKTFGGGEHACVTTEKIPGVLFKKDRNSSPMNDYVLKAERARKICKDLNLYLLYVPQCEVVGFNDTFVMEEMVELVGNSWESQRAAYQWVVSTPELEDYAQELFRQLTIFICLMKFSDVKYDNVPLMKNGRVAFFDLDENGSVVGLTKGSTSEDGLFSMIPFEWIDQFMIVARNHLPSDNFSQVEAQLISFKDKAQKRKAYATKIHLFYEKNKVTYSTQPLIFNKQLFRPEIWVYAEKIMQKLNTQISSLSHISLAVGRVLKISTESPSEYGNFAKLSCTQARTELHMILNDVFEELKTQGYLFSFTLHEAYQYYSVEC